MKTEISTFCETCLNSLNVLPPALGRTAERMEKVSDPALLERPLASLNDVRARLRSLVDKLRSQQAYLLIFGPLKSGKSTLMNAISGSYVSEVTSLPGYPCLVYVQHSREPHYSVTRYNGRESTFADGVVLKDVVADSHIALAQQIRATEERGSEFDPRTHFTEAIRRIDVKIPVQTLSESSTVLVDTPGLYSRMNFGYDVLTREFRDSAACAVFVVKTDNLFLEQVFTEFNELLGLFSRIFLVINVDSSKRDLQADGTLQPSAESEHPEQVIEAFKTLSMAGPLRQAYEQNRVRIHAVDLLSAASAFLTHNGSGQNGGEGGTDKQKEAFNAFLRDLTDYLNSSDYTTEFIRDSLRQGDTLCEELREIADSDELREVRDKQVELDEQLRDFDERLAAVDRLLQVDWNITFDKVRTENTARASDTAKADAAELTKRMRQAQERWFSGSESLKALEQQHWNPLLTSAAVALADDTQFRLRSLLDNSLGGAEPAAAVMTDLHAVDFSLGGSAQAALPTLHAQEPVEAYRITIKEEEVPVRKSVGDWLLFRKMATVRRRLFGEGLTQSIEVEIKQKRLGETTGEALHKIIDEGVKARFPSLPGKFSDGLLSKYVARFREEVTARLREERERLIIERGERQVPFETNAEIIAASEDLKTQAEKVSAELTQLAGQEHALPLVPENTGVIELQAEPAGPAFVSTTAA